MTVLETTLRGYLIDLVREAVREELGSNASGWAGCVRLREAAKLAGGVSVSTVEKWGRDGLNIQRKGRVRVVDVAELREFLARRETSTPKPIDRLADELLAKVTPMRRAR